MPERVTLRVALLGVGTIGSVIADALRSGRVERAELVATIDADGAQLESGRGIELEQLSSYADLVVEAAGQPALTELGPGIVAAGIDLLALSIGALADAGTWRRLTRGPGRLYLSTGAVGGLDLVRALADDGLLTKVTIRTTKRPTTLVQPWMDAQLRAQLTDAVAPVEVLRGSPAEIARAFPRSANVAMSTALATGDPALVEAVVVADPTCASTTHEITVDATIGSHRFLIGNHPSESNPATSAVVPHSVLRALRDLAGRRMTLI